MKIINVRFNDYGEPRVGTLLVNDDLIDSTLATLQAHNPGDLFIIEATDADDLDSVLRGMDEIAGEDQ